jgi:hypothetical protein
MNPKRVRAATARVTDLGLLIGGLSAMVCCLSGAPALAAGAKYYFELHKVEATVPVNPDIKEIAGEALKAELAARPEWLSDLGVGVGADRQAVAAELKRRKLSGFDLIVKIVQIKKEVKDPSPGSRNNQLVVSIRLAVLGTVIPGDKIAFSGEGEAGAEASVPERRIEAEATEMFKEATKSAVQQAIDQAVLKLRTPKATPMNESKRKRKKD